MSTIEAARYAKRVRAQHTVEAKLDDLSMSIEQLVSAIERRIKKIEYVVVHTANNR
jgi:hypothetical protein